MIDVAGLRALAWLVPAALTTIAVAVGPTSARERGAALLSFTWCFATLPVVGAAAIAAGAWRYEADGALIVGQPVDVLLGWALLWGPLARVLAARLPLALVVGFALFLDVQLMPHLQPLLHLGDRWLVGEAAALGICLVPAQWLARWTAGDRALPGRTALHLAQFAIGMGFLLPHAILAETHGSWEPLGRWGPGARSVGIQLAALLALPGLAAVLVFAERGGGTPVPFDPPKRLVTSGPYAFVRNPMQASTAALYLALGAALGSPWVAAAAAMSVAFGAGFAAWHEGGDLGTRFGEAWATYRRAVPMWVPRWRPWVPEPSSLWVAASCGPCRALGAWIAARDPVGLALRPAEEHPERLLRIRYEAHDGYRADGVVAIARALGHCALPWAAAGWLLALPGVSAAMQLLVDASGGGPRAVRPPDS